MCIQLKYIALTRRYWDELIKLLLTINQLLNCSSRAPQSPIFCAKLFCSFVKSLKNPYYSPSDILSTLPEMNTLDVDAHELTPDPEVLTNQVTQYIQAIFQQFEPYPPNINSERCKFLKIPRGPRGPNFDKLLKQIEDIIDQQRASMITESFHIIVTDGFNANPQIRELLKSLKIEHTLLCGLSNRLLLTISTGPHRVTTLVFYKFMFDVLYRLVSEVWTKVHFELSWVVREKILSKVMMGQSQLHESQHYQSVEPNVKQQLQELRQLVKVTLLQQLPMVPEQTNCTMNHILNQLLGEMYIDAQDQSTQESCLIMSLQNLLLHLKKDVQEAPQNTLLKLVCDDVRPGELVLTYEALSIPIEFYNNVYSICERLFMYKEHDGARRVIKYLYKDGGFKTLDYSISPAYLSCVRGAQNRPFIPSITVEAGRSDDIAKVLVDCAFTIVGTRFQTEAAYGVILHVDKDKIMLDSIDIIHFDVSLKSLVEIRDQLTGKEQASVSLVISQKAHQKLNDLKAMKIIREWMSSGDANEYEYYKLLDQLSKLGIASSIPNALKPIYNYRRPSWSEVMNTLRLYRRYTNDALEKESSEYNEIIQRCHDIAGQYMDDGCQRDILYCEGEVLLVEHIFKRKQTYHVDDNSDLSPLFSARPFTGLSLMEFEHLSIQPAEWREIFRNIASKFRKDSIGNELQFPLLHDLIRKDCLQEVAMLNYQNVPPDEAVAELEKAYKASSDGYVELKATVFHIDVNGQLRNWGIDPKERDYENEVLLIREYSKRYSKRTPSSFSPDSTRSLTFRDEGYGGYIPTTSEEEYDEPIPITSDEDYDGSILITSDEEYDESIPITSDEEYDETILITSDEEYDGSILLTSDEEDDESILISIDKEFGGPIAFTSESDCCSQETASPSSCSASSNDSVTEGSAPSKKETHGSVTKGIAKKVKKLIATLMLNWRPSKRRKRASH